MQPSFGHADTPQEGSGPMASSFEDEAELRHRALSNLRARRSFFVQLAVYVLINAVLLWSWASGGFGFPWPLFVRVVWGIGLFWQGWSLFGPGESEDRVAREMDRLRGGR